MTDQCGLVSDRARRCSRRIAPALASGRVDPDRLLFAQHPHREHVRQAVAEMETLHLAAAAYRAEPEWIAPATATEFIQTLLRDRRLAVLDAGTATP